MRVTQSLQQRCRAEFAGGADSRAYLLMDSLVRHSFYGKNKNPICWSPLSVMDFVQQSVPMASMAKEVEAYRQFSVMNKNLDCSVV